MRQTLLICGVLSVTAALFPQQPVFRAGADYVRVDVVVTDKNDRPIADLTKDDFTIEEHGRKQTIDDFQFVSVPVEHRTLDVSRVAPPADVATNLPRSEKSRLFVMVVDDLHILEQDLVPVKRIMTEFFQALSADDEVAVVFVSHSNDSQNFTSDPVLLMRTVDRVKNALGFGLDALGRSIPHRDNDKRYIQETARSADLTLKNVVAALAGSGHARRAIVYVTAGSIVPTVPPPGDMTYTDFEDLQELYAAAQRADVPIYTIDPRGQPLPEEAVRGGIGAVGTIGGGAGEGQRASIADNIVRQQDRLAENAINTGGRAFTNQSNLTKAVDEIVADNGSYYLLGYYPNPFAADGKFHEFTVKVTRPGTRVRARQGYVASGAVTSSSDPHAGLDAAMSAGVNVSGIALRAFAAPLAPTAKGVTTAVTVEVSYPARPADARDVDDELRMSVLALDPDAKIKSTSTKTLHFKGTASDVAPVALLIDDAIDLPAQPLTLRIGISSRVLGKTGTIQLPVDPRKISDKLQLSGVVIGLTNAAREPVLDGVTIANLVPFQPTTSRDFAPTDTLRVYARAFWGSKDASASATLTLTGPSPSSPRTITLAGARDGSGHFGAAIDSTVPLANLSPGDYQLAIAVALPNGQTTQRVVAIQIK